MNKIYLYYHLLSLTYIYPHLTNEFPLSIFRILKSTQSDLNVQPDNVNQYQPFGAFVPGGLFAKSDKEPAKEYAKEYAKRSTGKQAQYIDDEDDLSYESDGDSDSKSQSSEESDDDGAVDDESNRSESVSSFKRKPKASKKAPAKNASKKSSPAKGKKSGGNTKQKRSGGRKGAANTRSQANNDRSRSRDEHKPKRK